MMIEGLYSGDRPRGQESLQAFYLPSVRTPARNPFKAFRPSKPITNPKSAPTDSSGTHGPYGISFLQTPSPSSHSSLSLKTKSSSTPSSEHTNKVIRAKRAEPPKLAQVIVDTPTDEETFSRVLDARIANVVRNSKPIDSPTQEISSPSRSDSLDGPHKSNSLKSAVASSPESSICSYPVSNKTRTGSKPTGSQSGQTTTTGSSGSAVSLVSGSERTTNSFKWVSVMSTPATNPWMLGPTQLLAFDPDHPLLPVFGCIRSNLRSLIVLATPLWKRESTGSVGKAAHKQSLRARFSSNKVEWKNRVLILTSWSEELDDPSEPNKVRKVLLGYLHLFKTNASTTREIGRMELDAECEISPLDGENLSESDTDGRTNVLSVTLNKRPKTETKRTWGCLEDTLTVQFESHDSLRNWVHEINSIIFVKRAESVGLGEAARDYRSKNYPLTGDLSLALANIFEKSLKHPPRIDQETSPDPFRDPPAFKISRRPSFSSAEPPDIHQPLHSKPVPFSVPELNEFGARPSKRPSTATGIITRPVLIGSSNPRVSHLAVSATPSTIGSRQPELPRHSTNPSKTSNSSTTRERSTASDSLEESVRQSDSIWARELEIERLRRTEVELRAELELKRLKSVERQLRAELMQERKRNERGMTVHSEVVLDGIKLAMQNSQSVGNSEDRPAKVPSSRYASRRKRSSTIHSEASSFYYDSQGGRRLSDGTSCTSEDYVPSIVSPSSSIRHQTSKTSLDKSYSGQPIKNVVTFGVSFPSRDIERNRGLLPKEEPLFQIPSIRFTPPTSLVYADDYSTSPTSMEYVDTSSAIKISMKAPVKNQSLPIDFDPIDRSHSLTRNRPRSSSTTSAVPGGGRRGSRVAGSSPPSSSPPIPALPASHVGGRNDMYNITSFTYGNLSFPSPPPPPGPAPICSLPPLPPLPALKTE